MPRIARATALRVLLLCAAVIPTAPASAQSWNFGATLYGDESDGPQAELLVERSFRAFGHLGRWMFAPALAARLGDHSQWVGGGIIGTRPFADGLWQIEAGVMPGYYNADDSRADLGSDLEFRSFIALDRRLSDRLAVGIAAEHMSNAGAGDRNPGENRVMLRLVLFDRPRS